MMDKRDEWTKKYLRPFDKQIIAFWEEFPAASIEAFVKEHPRTKARAVKEARIKLIEQGFIQRLRSERCM